MVLKLRLRIAAKQILHKVAAVAELIDAAEGGDSYTQTVRLMRRTG